MESRSGGRTGLKSSITGKYLVLDVDTGHSDRFTAGHRNPQGLYVDSEQHVWSTEQGPQGGDELNMLSEGANYGWPFVTYGTEYFQFTWPIEQSGGQPSGFRSPIYAWIPSIGVSSLIGIETDRFPRWKGNLLVASLREQTLYRVGIDHERVIYVEPLTIGRRIRDLIEGPQGDIWMWGDRGELITLSIKPQSRGETVFTGCASCHSLRVGAAGLAPSLEHIVGRTIASGSDYQYSAALRAVGGRWTEDRLDAFLANPDAFAPGSLMSYGVPSAADRSAVISFLRDTN